MTFGLGQNKNKPQTSNLHLFHVRFFSPFPISRKLSKKSLQPCICFFSFSFFNNSNVCGPCQEILGWAHTHRRLQCFLYKKKCMPAFTPAGCKSGSDNQPRSVFPPAGKRGGGSPRTDQSMHTHSLQKQSGWLGCSLEQVSLPLSSSSSIQSHRPADPA